LAVAGLALGACEDKGSLGEYTDTDVGSGDDAATSTGSTGGSASASSSASASGTSEGQDSGDAGTGPGPGACPDEGNCQLFPIDCTDGSNACGTLDSIFDDEGCLRQSCSGATGCGDGERCYSPQDFGGCTGSAVFCEDDVELQTCVCGGTADCGGAYCIPEGLYPTPAPGPGSTARVTDDCAPDDGPAFTFTFGLPGDACDIAAPPPGTELATIQLWIDALDPGVYPLGQFVSPQHYGSYDDGTGVVQNATAGSVTITAVDAAGVDGSWELVLGEGGSFIGGSFEDMAYCPADVLCG
jgi:hypothetical protein